MLVVLFNYQCFEMHADSLTFDIFNTKCRIALKIRWEAKAE